MPESDRSKYEVPRVVRLGDPTKGRGNPSCSDGNTDISCGPGTGASPHCNAGNSAYGCLTGTSPVQGGSGGCEPGNGVYTL